MKKNVGSVDRVLRIVLGVVIVALGLYYQSWWGVLGIIPLFTASISSCPLYMPFGISTCKTKETEK
ncbi:MAG: DUF2892 domain-containing protein [Ignavibacteria bacterium CG_4_8_14_3_um_filter_37_9]|nr:DUF2892 domain-containing protein [Ignavibacteria bacterium]OIO20276.1 MAG: hypothetical protein AUJ54_05770 [Ignavibacteria bacterium CG1_02_37_35]PIP78866.1 MAG: hypothetical protein COW85_02955 [Ignavibacteria bacterium CG22_combo_CG10-13_8_21_14_all_37_15]PIS43972.1 MAG: DUF2892 domain-containing protein [Ignavibacteria bacterium CG08_land_8_20_14_0_20_37_9]PIW99842.1 MAG: DUF2892 domain-containing protein [Ignavibacteria bacterium CG_4_8_14_3_um_filter_37_9]PIX92892.1 MAG: DUF2892 doma